MLEDLRSMSVSEKPIGLEILVDFNEMEIAARILAGAARAGLTIADNAGVRGDPTGFREGTQCQDHARGIATGIGDQSRGGNLGRVEFRNSVDGFLEPIGVRRGQLVPGGEGFRLAKAECTAEIHNPDTGADQGWRQLGRNFMRGGEKRCAGVTRNDGFHRKRTKRSFAPAAELRKELCEAFRAVAFANVEDRRPQLGMAQKNSRQLQTGITGDPHDRDLARVSHFKKASIFFWRDSRDFLLGVMIKTVSSPAMVPAISGNFAPSTAAARGCAPLGGVFRTSRFSAGRISRRNSPRARAKGGSGVDSSGSAVAGL